MFICDAIGGSSDSMWCDPDYDALYEQQLLAPDDAERKAIVDPDAADVVYDAAPYHILYYDDNLHAYRTDKFAGWQNQPTANGTPCSRTGRSATPC